MEKLWNFYLQIFTLNNTEFVVAKMNCILNLDFAEISACSSGMWCFGLFQDVIETMTMSTDPGQIDKIILLLERMGAASNNGSIW